MCEDTLTASYFLKTKAESWELNKNIFDVTVKYSNRSFVQVDETKCYSKVKKL